MGGKRGRREGGWVGGKGTVTSSCSRSCDWLFGSAIFFLCLVFFFWRFFGQPFSVSYFFFLETGIYIFFHFGSFNEHISRAVGVVNEQKKKYEKKMPRRKKKESGAS